MRYCLVILLGVSFIACKQRTEVDTRHLENYITKVPRDSFQTILDSAQVKGSILIWDEQKNVWYSNDFQRADSGFIPASTFKIPNTLIALETGVVNDDSTLLKWDGEERNVNSWNQDLIFRDAFHASCVPCYRKIARDVGLSRMREHLVKFEFGEMQVDSSSLDLFWLTGPSRVSQFQQIDFLKRFYHSELPISDRTEQIAKRMMIAEETPEYSMVVKTGLTRELLGWCVGWVEKEEGTYFFASNMEPLEDPRAIGFDVNTRKLVTRAALKEMGVLN